MKVDQRIEKNSKSLLALEALLLEVLQDPALFVGDLNLIAALKSQGGLAKFESLERGILQSSTNTMKRISERVLPEGFRRINRLRTEALGSLIAFKAREEHSNKPTKASLTLRLKEIDGQLQQALQDAWHITMAFEKSLSQGRRYAEQAGNPAVLALCKKEQEELRLVLSLCKRPSHLKAG